MDTSGIVIGVLTFFLIGMFHPIVIKTEYYFGSRCWPVFLAAGAVCLVGSLFVKNGLLSAALGVTGISCLWSILELKEQEKRVAKGWFPKQEKRKEKP